MNGSVTSVEIKTIKKFRLCINSAMIASFALNPEKDSKLNLSGSKE